MPRRRPPTFTPPVFWRNARLPFLEGRCSRGTPVCYRPHTHPTLSVGVVDEGSARAILGGHAFTLRAGDVVVIGPGVVHSCNPRPGRRWSYRMFYFEWDWVRRVTPALAREFAPDRAHAPVRTAAAAAAVEMISAAISGPPASAGPETTVARALRRILRQARPVTGAAPARDAGRAAIVAAREFLDRHCDRRLSHPVLAQELGQDRFQFIRRFRSHLGLTPHAYKLDQQVNAARRLLARGLPIAEVAQALGFADQSHFQRTFKSRTAATPAQYQGARPAVTRPVRGRAAGK